MPPYEDRIISGYRLTRTAFYRDTALTEATLYRDAAALGPPYIGIPPYSDRLTRTALYRDTAFLRPPSMGETPPAAENVVPIGGYLQLYTVICPRLCHCSMKSRPLSIKP